MAIAANGTKCLISNIKGIMKKILLIATGGTIASKPTDNGLAPQLGFQEIIDYVPEIKELADIDAIQLFNIDSTNLYWKHWIEIAKCIQENYDKYDGFVVTHGTDTMAYTASAISYMVQNSKKPIVFTGSQKSIYMRDTDARNNLYNAFVYAVDDSACLVHIVFENKIIIGNRARKIRTKSYNAFMSVDFPEVGVIREGRVIHYVNENVCQLSPNFYFNLNPKVFVLKIIPGQSTEIFNSLKDICDCLVVESFGAGNLPLYDNKDFSYAIKNWVALGKTIVVTTQVPHEGSDMSIYEAGNTFKQYGVIEAYDMTLESLVTKMMWVLGQTNNPEEIKKLFYKKIHKDII